MWDLLFFIPRYVSLQLIDGVCRIVWAWPSDDWKTAFGILIICIEFFIPVFVVLFCYGRIIWALTRRINTDVMRKNRGMSTTADLATDKFLLARRNTIKTLLIVALCFIICWSQNEIRYFLYNCGYDMDFNSTYHQFTVLMVFFNCTLNPFILLSIGIIKKHWRNSVVAKIMVKQVT